MNHDHNINALEFFRRVYSFTFIAALIVFVVVGSVWLFLRWSGIISHDIGFVLNKLWQGNFHEMGQCIPTLLFIGFVFILGVWIRIVTVIAELSVVDHRTISYGVYIKALRFLPQATIGYVIILLPIIGIVAGILKIGYIISNYFASPDVIYLLLLLGLIVVVWRGIFFWDWYLGYWIYFVIDKHTGVLGAFKQVYNLRGHRSALGQRITLFVPRSKGVSLLAWPSQAYIYRQLVPHTETKSADIVSE